MAGVELALGIEQISVATLVRQRAGGKRRDELLRGFGQYAADVNMPLLETPDQVQRLVGGDAAADDQGDPGLSGRIGAPHRGRPGVRRRQDGLRRCCGELGAALYKLPEDHPDLLFDGAAVFGRAQPQIGLDGFVEFSDGQASHGHSRLIAMLA